MTWSGHSRGSLQLAAQTFERCGFLIGVGLLFGFDCPYTASYARRFWQIIRSFRGTMECLSLDATAFYELHKFSTGLPGDFPDISFPRLCSLTLGYDYMVSGYGRHTTTAGLLDFLHRLDMPHLRTVNLVLHIDRRCLSKLFEAQGSESYDASSDVPVDPSSDLQTYATTLPSLPSLSILYLVYAPPNTTPEEFGSVTSVSDGAKNNLIYRHLVAQEPWRIWTSSSETLYQRGILTVRSAELEWQHEFTPARLSVTQWKHHVSTQVPTVSSLHQIEYDDDLVDILLQL
ncbi:hypothetical protein OH76DRAFT_797427 [Lentinus brumalis]|uniref:Uncharacterized protein n=1 Tax=Lentinus brumalis TaxID=2498619 RepID=A0A371D3P1_9APHY|nr:hypothetical protein OH76DRAFT_797427 [Polyporus brumalis]